MMRNLRCGVYASLALIAWGTVGCSKSPPPPPPAAAAAAPTVPPAANAPSAPAAPAVALTPPVAPTAGPVDAKLQQKLLGMKPTDKASDSLPPLKVSEPVTPLAPAASKISVEFIPADAFLVMAVHPRRVYEHPVIRQLRESLPPDVAEMGGMGDGMEQLEFLKANFGIAPEGVDEILVVLDKDLLDSVMNNPRAAPPVGTIFRTSAPLDVNAIVARILNGPMGAKLVEHDGVAMLMLTQGGPSPATPPGGLTFPPEAPAEAPAEGKEDPAQPPGGDPPAGGNAAGPPKQETIAVAFVNDSLVLAGTEAVVRKMISAPASKTASTDLTKQVESLGNPLFGVAVELGQIHKPLESLLPAAPPPVALFSPFILSTRTVTFKWDLDGAEFLSLNVEFDKPESAVGLYGMLNGQFEKSKQTYSTWRKLASERVGAESIAFLDQVVNGAAFTNSDETLSFVIPKLNGLEKLPEALKPSIEQAKAAAEVSRKRNNLKQIGLAMSNFDGDHSHMPALSGMGNKSMKNPGLSWRVYLLPYLDQTPLYNEFKLDEPWDSETNKKLISRMPKVYGSSLEFKSNIQIVTGEGTPFQMETGPRVADIVDGFSSTIMVLEAGEDVSEIWTKPGGLVYDSMDPLKCLGAAKNEFRAVTFDGASWTIRGIDGDTFLKAIQHRDGGRFEFPE